MFFDGVVYFMIEIDDVFVGVIGFGLFYLILLFLVFLVLFATASRGAALVLLTRGCRRILLALEHDFGKDAQVAQFEDLLNIPSILLQFILE